MNEEAFDQAYRLISDNPAQKQAVDTTEGPVLVIAGPGTGKTQLLSVRVGQILKNNSTISPNNIICLTFTETGAANMRDRLSRFIGQSAYDVTINTYHAFGSDLIRRFPEYFVETRLQNSIDNLGRHQIVRDIVEGLSYRNPLKQTQHHIQDLIGTISEVKRALLTSTDLRAIARENILFIESVNQAIPSIFQDFKKMPPKTEQSIGYFEQTLELLKEHGPAKPASERYGTLADVAIAELSACISEAVTSGKSKQLTVWKNDWLAKDGENRFVFDHLLETHRIEALADVLETYEATLRARGLYDYDDMILRAIEVLEQNDSLKYTLQEQYQYVLLDEFQDTNKAQLRLVELLTDNPVNEGRPNVMAVGDDDQAIYAFQGARYSNMIDFYNLYRDVVVVNLTENYRSHADILETAANVASQIHDRVFSKLDGTTKELHAANQELPQTAAIGRHEFLSDIAQYDWIAAQVQQLIRDGTRPSEIAVLAPRHAQLEPLVQYLNARNIPLRYEKRENILEAPVVRQVLTMARLVTALGNKDTAAANALWPEVLSYEFWHLPVSEIWHMSWQITEHRADQSANWSKTMLEDGSKFRIPALLFLSMASRIKTESFETILDYIIGNAAIDTHEADYPKVTSPLRDFYLSETMQTDNALLFYETLSHLTVLREKVRAYQATNESTMLLADVLELVAMYEAADERMLNDSPYNQDAEAVQLMTVFKAKGLEYEHVFLPSSLDDCWGGSGGSGSNKLTLPPNLAPIRYSGTTEDERLRILYVAITRAKYGLHLTSYRHTYAGRVTKRLKYLDEQEQADGTVKAMVLPISAQIVQAHDTSAPELRVLELDWHAKHLQEGLIQTHLRALLQERLRNYQLSPTHLNTFTDLQYGGPQAFFFQTLLRFPSAPSLDGQFGNVIHETLERLQQRLTETGTMPSKQDVITDFKARMRRSKLLEPQLMLQLERGEAALSAYLAERGHTFKPSDKAEINFRNENVVIDGVHMGGKIDRMEIDDETKEIIVVDYKTGKSYDRWASDMKLHKYRQQLYCYKLLIEHSRTYTNYTVTGGRLEFIEPDKHGKIHTLPLGFEDDELLEVRQLLRAVWQHVHALDFPDISEYAATMPGVRAFEKFLIDTIK